MANLITVRLQRGDGQAWGFRLQGGKDFSAPLVLQRVNGGSVADQAGLMAGDALIKVNGTEVFNMRHKDAQDVIVAAGNSFELTVSRGGATWRPSVTPTGSLPSPSPSLPGNVTPVTRTSLAATPQEMKPIGSGHNTAAKPFAAVNGNDGQIKSIVNNQYNTPVGMYSDETIAETLSSQAEVLAGGVLGVNFKKNERVYSPANSEVYKLLHEQGDDPEPDSVYSNNFHYSVNKLESTSSHFYATQSHAIGGYATAGRLPVGSLTGGRPRGPSPLPPQMQGQVPRPPMPKPPMMQQPQPQRPVPQQGVPAQQGAPKVAFPPQPQPQQQPQQQAPPAPAPTSAFRPAPNTVPRAGIPPKVHNEGHKTGVQAISAALNAHANLNGRAQSPYGSNGTHTSLGPLSHSPSHSRSSSTTSSSGYCNSSSLSPVQSNKVSPLHSRTSSENELIDRSHSSNSNGSNASELSGNAYPVCPASPPLPPPPPPLTMEECTLQEPGPEVPPAPPQTDASAPLVFGANGLATPAAPADSEQTDGTVTQNDYGFYYQTMGGRVIRSVLPPGKNSTYKVNQNNITPKPFGAPLPVSPLAQVQPPASYPPVAGSVPTPFSAALVGAPPAQPAPMAAPAPAPMAAAPAPAPMAAPAMAPASVPTPQDGGTEQEPAENESEEKAEGEADDGARERSESPAPVFAWPPKPEVVDTIPTATPIYIPPPETQRVVIKPITVVPPMKVKEKSKTPPDDAAGQQQQQSKSAPELCHRQEETEQQQHQDDEELSDSFGMTTTTTATTTTANSASSEEYRMYQTQCSQPIVTYYDTPQYELERPFSSGQRSAQFGREIPSQMEDLPVPSGRLSMMDALATASDRPYTPFSEVRFDRSSDVYQDMVREQPSVPVDPDRQCSAFANVGGNRTPKPFVPVVPEIREVPPEEPERGESSRRSSVVAVESRRSSKVATAEEVRRASTVATAAAAVVESRRSSTATLESRQDSRRGSGGSGSADTAQATNPPAPKPTVTTGTAKEPLYPGHDAHPPEHYSLALRRETKSPLNHPAEIPPYQRKWFNLPTQNPPRTPEPEELRTNVPLAFVNTHSHTAALSKPVAKPPGRPVNKPPTTPYTTIQNRNIPVVQLPAAGGPELDAELAQYHSAHARLAHKGVIDRGQSFTPSLILTKHATSIPYYQHQLGFEEYFAEVKQFDGHTTPQPSRTKSPAFGPPPNPLKPHVPPSREGIPVESGLYLSMGKLHGVPWYANKDHVPADIQKKMQEQLHLEATQRFGRSSVVQQQQHQQQHQEVTHEQVTMSSSVSTEQQQQQQQQRMTREEASAERAIQSAQQVGNALIQKRTRFVEEHESSSRSQSVSRNAPSESSRYSSKIKEDEAPQKGFVAQQTRRFSGQDEALNLPPQPTEQEQKEQQQKEQQAEQAALIQQLQEEQQKRQIAPPKKAAPPAPIRHVEPPTPKPAPPPTTFPSTDLFSEEFVDHFPHISARKASVLLPPKPATRPDCVSPSSFKAQFNEFMIGAGPMPPLPPMREEDDGVEPDTRSDTQKLIQSWPPQLPPQPAAAPAAVAAPPANGAAPAGSQPASKPSSRSNSTAFLDFLNRPTLNPNTDRSTDRAGTNSFNKGRAACSTSAPNRGRGVMNKAVGPGGRVPLCGCCQQQIRGPFITALGRIWCPDHFICHNANCKRPLADIGFVEEKGDLYCEYCFEEFLAPLCSKCNGRVKGDCLNAIGKQFHPECFKCTYCGKQFGNSPFFLEEGDPYCEKDWNDLFTTKCFACGFPVEAGDKWVEALNNNYHSQCFNCTSCKKNLEGQSFFAKGGRPFCKNHAR
ncbi:PDZ and LIM domain protein Zasp-like isoform X7 [Anopheles arabiensis]|uniref:PDZ and LIM domain protein Zasp-like isoform X7 n=1 Tax=Anopheles arabiensis TaxID=7173 RepID=UPI001AAD946D|nr:PDZ and LIM domain protein Zasp-like isoform X7 [Anopheles arabiensis]